MIYITLQPLVDNCPKGVEEDYLGLKSLTKKAWFYIINQCDENLSKVVSEITEYEFLIFLEEFNKNFI